MRHLVAAGSAPGRLHLLTEKPGQDAYRTAKGSWGAAAVVCDGCGSEPGSGLGAAIGAAAAIQAAVRQVGEGGRFDLPRLETEVLSAVALIARTAGLELHENFLFTLLGVVSTAHGATVFGCGDGVIAVDGTVRQLGPFPGNAPPYLSYALCGVPTRLECFYSGPARSVLVGTDGAADADLPRYWSEARFLSNPDLIRRSLKLEKPADDATVAVILREEP